ncbi:hypothetical protein [Pedobacter jejuensis]|uniref:hypothetical protein n=1 Tax=Pedobacter jejuensis TaxID=1268550 RepID=UPI00142D9A67|nr:hypothetical protein [Pedobacter jejuensis]
MIRNTVIRKLAYQKFTPRVNRSTVHSRRNVGAAMRPFAPLGANPSAKNPKD